MSVLASRGLQNQQQTDFYDRFTTESTIGIMSTVTTIVCPVEQTGKGHFFSNGKVISLK